MYANFYGRSKHIEVGIFNDKNVKELISSRYLKMLVFTRKYVGALRHISNALCRRHIGHCKLCVFLDIVKISLKIDF
jgi:hypothetical protein